MDEKKMNSDDSPDLSLLRCEQLPAGLFQQVYGHECFDLKTKQVCFRMAGLENFRKATGICLHCVKYSGNYDSVMDEFFPH